jgi:hypothetical protein
MKRFMQKLLFIYFFCIYDAIIFCELPGNDKILGCHRKKIFVIIYFIFINKDKETFSLSLFYKYKDSLYFYFIK